MKMKQTVSAAVNLVLLFSILSFAFTTLGQGTAFTYQGRLSDTGNAANGSYDLQFTLYSSATGPGSVAGPIPKPGVVLSNGLFTVTLDFGAEFLGSDRWLEIAVRTNGAGTFATLSPRQQLTPAPYAITAENVISGGLAAGTYGNAVTLNNPANSFTGDGSGLTNLNASTLNGFGYCALPCYWNVSGNAGTTPTSNFIGTTDNQPLNFKVNHALAIQFAPGTTLPNIVGGLGAFRPSVLASGVSGVVIAGGNAPSGAFSGIGAGDFMSAFDDDDTIGGGFGNKVGTDNGDVTDAAFATVAGGIFNVAANFGATVGGGAANTAAGTRAVVAGGNGNLANGDYSSVGGGSANTVQFSTFSSAISGGYGNTIQSNSSLSFIGGGTNNIIQLGSICCTLGGGYQNTVTNSYGTVGGGYGNISSGVGATVGGGQANWAVGYSATIAGGDFNHADANGIYSFVGGGYANNTVGGFSTVSGGEANGANGTYATVPGGEANSAAGEYSFAAGHQATALHQGAFVWADSQSVAFNSTTNDQFNVRAQGGVRIITGNTNLTLDGQSVAISTGPNTFTGPQAFNAGIFLNSSNGFSQSSVGTFSIDAPFRPGARFLVLTNGNVGISNIAPTHLLVVGSAVSPAYCDGLAWVNASDRNTKEGFAAINARAVLEKVSALPITQWKYKAEANGTEHLGPTAQDFHAAFSLNGKDETHISTVDESGVALAAIQGLNQKIESENAALLRELQRTDAENAELKQRLQVLEEKMFHAMERH